MPISEFGGATVESVQWLFRQPLYLFHPWWPRRESEICVIRTASGERVECDALVLLAGNEAVDPSPIPMKVSALNRWVAAHRVEGT